MHRNCHFTASMQRLRRHGTGRPRWKATWGVFHNARRQRRRAWRRSGRHRNLEEWQERQEHATGGRLPEGKSSQGALRNFEPKGCVHNEAGDHAYTPPISQREVRDDLYWKTPLKTPAVPERTQGTRAKRERKGAEKLAKSSLCVQYTSLGER